MGCIIIIILSQKDFIIIKMYTPILLEACTVDPSFGFIYNKATPVLQIRVF